MNPRRKRRLRETASAYLLLSPQLIGLLAFGALPILIALGISFTEWDVIGPMKFVGLTSIVKELRHPYFLKSLINTLEYVGMNVPLSIGCALIASLLLIDARFKVLFRALYFMPVVTSVVAGVMVWQWLYHPDFGPLNFLIHRVLGFPGKILWLGSTKTAMLSIVMMNTWQTLGYGLVLFLAGLQAVPAVYYEAAIMDGANAWQKTRAITFPLLTPTILYSVITSVIASFQVFGQPYLLTGGGPLRSTYTIAMHIYQKGFVDLEMGRACAISLVLFLIIMAITGIQFLFSRKWVFYEGG